ncbi:hypothetical protein OG596_34875 [Streptomyces sp. NBC_01102]|uniref:hypothetical protein n=1 Tax=unclassified Streptomyces TaxID=2593676 RepID=UPI00386CD594|nr:hypothetical protein OG596_34875 [Streptomyces sp. NBC_01102]
MSQLIPCEAAIVVAYPSDGSPEVYAERAGQGPSVSWVFLTGGGCTMEWYVSLVAVEHPVPLWDADGWEPDWGQDPHDGLRYAAPSLRQSLWTWADGGNVWDDAPAQLD